MIREIYRSSILILSPVILLVSLLGIEVICRFTAVGVPWNADSFGRRRTFSRPVPPSAVRMVCLGDSLTFGARVREAQSYPTQLGKLLKIHKRQVHIVNAGISGHTSVQTLARINRDALDFCPSVVVLWVGTNDGMLKSQPDPRNGVRPYDTAPLATKSAILTTLDSLSSVMYLTSALGRPYAAPKDLSPRVEIDAFTSTYERILKTIGTQAQTQVIALKIPKMPEHFMHAPKDLVEAQRQMHATYNLVIAHLCKQNRVPIITPDSFLDANCYLNDGLHLNQEGNARVAGALLEFFLCNSASTQWIKYEKNAPAHAKKYQR